jgi:hypothetical protein
MTSRYITVLRIKRYTDDAILQALLQIAHSICHFILYDDYVSPFQNTLIVDRSELAGIKVNKIKLEKYMHFLEIESEDRHTTLAKYTKEFIVHTLTTEFDTLEEWYMATLHVPTPLTIHYAPFQKLVGKCSTFAHLVPIYFAECTYRSQFSDLVSQLGRDVIKLQLKVWWDEYHHNFYASDDDV